jgi:hypothetical protein
LSLDEDGKEELRARASKASGDTDSHEGWIIDGYQSRITDSH